MSKCYMITLPRGDGMQMCKQFAKIGTYIWNHDVHKWVIGAETGKNGYKHWQIRIMGQNDEDMEFDQIKREISEKAHVEKASDTWEYERKEGMFWAWNDTKEVRQCRFGHPRGWQKYVLQAVRDQNDRQVDHYINPDGNEGKSWLTGHLYETGQAWVVDVDRPENIKRDVANIVKNQGYRPIIIFDIPRECKIGPEMYTALEKVKDGLLIDGRYSCNIVHIRGVKVIVFTNKGLDYTKLSADRWRSFRIEKGGKVIRNK